MSVRVEWIDVENLSLGLDTAEVAYEDLHAAEEPIEGRYVLTLGGDEVTAVEGTLDDLAHLGSRIRVLVARERDNLRNEKLRAELEERRRKAKGVLDD